MSCFYSNYFDEIHNICDTLDKAILDKIIEELEHVKEADSKVILAGNGGSAALASHVAVDLTKAAGIRAINFNEADLITCFANDFGYENWLAEALRFYAQENDLVILVSSSGESENIIRAANAASERNLSVVTFSGFSAKNRLRKMGKLNAWADSSNYNIVEMSHHIWLLAIVDNYINKRN